MQEYLNYLHAYLTHAIETQSDGLDIHLGAAGTDGVRLLAAALPGLSLRRLRLESDADSDVELDTLAAALAQQKSLAHFEWIGAKLSADGFQTLGRLMVDWPALSALDLNGCNLGHGGAFELAPFFARMSTLQSLGLRFTGLDRVACAALAEPLAAMASLESLVLASNSLSFVECALLRPALAALPCLRELDLSLNNLVNDAGERELASILHAVAPLELVNLGCNSLTLGADLAAGLQRFSGLREFNFIYSNFDDESWRRMCELLIQWENLTSLNLGKIRASEPQVERLASALHQRPALKNLGLSGIGDQPNVGSAFAFAISSGTRLVSLDVGDNFLGPGCAPLLKSVARHRNLETLLLDWGQIAAADIRAGAEWLAGCRSLRELNLSNNRQLGDEGLLAILPALQGMFGLRTLQLNSVGIGDEVAAELSDCLRSLSALVEVELEHNHFGPAGVRLCEEAAEDLPQIRTFKIEVGRPRDTAFEPPSELSITELRLEQKGIGDAGCVTLAEFLTSTTQLQRLAIDGNEITEIGAAALGPALAALTQLRSFSVWQNQLGDDGVAIVLRSLQSRASLTELTLDNLGITHAGLPQLGELLRDFPQLQSLILSCTDLADDTFSQLAAGIGELRRLRTLRMFLCELSAEQSESLADALGNLPELAELVLGWNPWGDVGVEKLSTAVGRLSSLTDLQLNRSRFGARGMHALADCLPKCPQLRRLNLGSNKWDVSASNELARVLDKLPNLESLKLDYSDLDDLATLGPAIGRLKNLTELDLNHNDLDHAALADCLAEVRAAPLQTLDLGTNRLGNPGARLLAERLSDLPALTQLSLSSNRIGSAVTDLGGRLSLCPELRALDLSFNAVSDKQMPKLAAALAKLENLEELNLRCNSIRMGGLQALARSLRGHPKLRRLDIDGNSIDLPSEVVAGYNPETIFRAAFR